MQTIQIKLRGFPMRDALINKLLWLFAGLAIIYSMKIYTGKLQGITFTKEMNDAEPQLKRKVSIHNYCVTGRRFINGF